MPDAHVRFDGHIYRWSPSTRRSTDVHHETLLYSVVLPYEPLVQYVERPALIMLAALLAATVLVPISVEAFLRLTVVQPFQRLLAGLDEASRGNLHVCVPVQFQDEIGSLTERFNQMIHSIHTAQTRYYEAVEQQTHERERISQDVHDDVGSMLTRIALMAETLKSHSLERQMQSRLEAIADAARAATQMLSEIIWAIKPVNDSLENFFAYCREYINDLFEETQIQHVLEMPTAVPDLQLLPEMRRNAFLVMKEALTNVLKHAEASSVHITCLVEHEVLMVCIADDGCGFDTESVGVECISSGRRGGNGLLNMQRRVARLGGRLSVESVIGRGTRLSAQIPLRSQL